MQLARFEGLLAVALLLAAETAGAQDSLDTCWAQSDDRVALGQCLEDLQVKTLEEMNRSYDAAAAVLQELDAITGRPTSDGQTSERALEQSQKAFELYRDLDCQVERLQAASGTGAQDFFLSCWISRTSDRTAVLLGLAGGEVGVPLPGTQWRAEDIEGQGVMDNSQSTLVFETESKVVGEAGCNRYFGPVEIKDNTLTFNKFATTQKACPEAVMDQEQKFLAALSKAASYSFTHGLLLLLDESGTPILRFSPAQN
ncbi:MAG: META domain-containing protein [Pseudomonadota bacterium]